MSRRTRSRICLISVANRSASKAHNPFGRVVAERAKCEPQRERRSGMERKRFDVRSRRNAELFECDRPWAAISISTLGDFPVLSEGNRRGLLQFVFADTVEPGEPDSFTECLAVEILDFAQRMWGRVDVFLIHCEVGLSRSPAVAAALSRIYYYYYYYNDDGPWFEFDFPNRLAYRLLIETRQRT